MEKRATRAVKCTIAGRVQGVFYRASAAERASSLGLSGWVRNREDGSVELAASGAPEAVESFVAWLWRGPAHAEVRSVVLEELGERLEPGFKVLR